MNFKLPPLPFAPEAVAGWLSQETLDYHHGKHHRGYVEKLNSLLPSSGFDDSTLEEIICNANGPLFNNAAQAWNHTFYWLGICPAVTEYDANTLGNQSFLTDTIERDFGSSMKFLSLFEKSAIDLFGSGWVWLCQDRRSDKLVIVQTSNADNPIQKGLKPLLTCDVWEHAYYIDFRNNRKNYVSGFMRSINWEFVANNLSLPKIIELTSMMAEVPGVKAAA